MGKPPGAAAAAAPEVLEAPVYHPTLSEFADPGAYIARIRVEASAAGFCRYGGRIGRAHSIVPPAGWIAPPGPARAGAGVPQLATLRQSVHRLQAAARPLPNTGAGGAPFRQEYLAFLDASGEPRPQRWPALGGPGPGAVEIDFQKLYQAVLSLGGHAAAGAHRRWRDVARQLELRPRAGGGGAGPLRDWGALQGALREFYAKHLLPFEAHKLHMKKAAGKGEGKACAGGPRKAAKAAAEAEAAAAAAAEAEAEAEAAEALEATAAMDVDGSPAGPSGTGVAQGGPEDESNDAAEEEDEEEDEDDESAALQAILALESAAAAPPAPASAAAAAHARAPASAAGGPAALAPATAMLGEISALVEAASDALTSTAMCELCGGGEHAESMLICDGCNQGFHMHCLSPPLDAVPEEDWFCAACVRGTGLAGAASCVPGPTMGLPAFEAAAARAARRVLGNPAAAMAGEAGSSGGGGGGAGPSGAGGPSPAELEARFWAIVENRPEQPPAEVEVLVGSAASIERRRAAGAGAGADESRREADAGAEAAGANGEPPRPPSAGDPKGDPTWDPAWDPAALARRAGPHGSLLRFLAPGDCQRLPSAGRSTLQLSMLFSSDTWHAAPHGLYALTYAHWGAPRVCYGLPAASGGALEAALKAAWGGDAAGPMPDAPALLAPAALAAAGARVARAVLAAGEFLVTFPQARVASISLGLACHETALFAPADWIPLAGPEAERCRALRRPPALPADALLMSAAASACSGDGAEALSPLTAARLAPAIEALAAAERASRERLWAAGVRRAGRMPAGRGLRPGERADGQCAVCKFALHLSAVACDCTPERPGCLPHAAVLCECAPAARTLLYRHTLEELSDVAAACRAAAAAGSAAGPTPPRPPHEAAAGAGPKAKGEAEAKPEPSAVPTAGPSAAPDSGGASRGRRDRRKPARARGEGGAGAAGSPNAPSAEGGTPGTVFIGGGEPPMEEEEAADLREQRAEAAAAWVCRADAAAGPGARPPLHVLETLAEDAEQFTWGGAEMRPVRAREARLREALAWAEDVSGFAAVAAAAAAAHGREAAARASEAAGAGAAGGGRGRLPLARALALLAVEPPCAVPAADLVALRAAVAAAQALAGRLAAALASRPEPNAIAPLLAEASRMPIEIPEARLLREASRAAEAWAGAVRRALPSSRRAKPDAPETVPSLRALEQEGAALPLSMPREEATLRAVLERSEAWVASARRLLPAAAGAPAPDDAGGAGDAGDAGVGAAPIDGAGAAPIDGAGAGAAAAAPVAGPKPALRELHALADSLAALPVRGEPEMQALSQLLSKCAAWQAQARRRPQDLTLEELRATVAAGHALPVEFEEMPALQRAAAARGWATAAAAALSGRPGIGELRALLSGPHVPAGADADLLRRLTAKSDAGAAWERSAAEGWVRSLLPPGAPAPPARPLEDWAAFAREAAAVGAALRGQPEVDALVARGRAWADRFRDAVRDKAVSTRRDAAAGAAALPAPSDLEALLASAEDLTAEGLAPREVPALKARLGAYRAWAGRAAAALAASAALAAAPDFDPAAVSADMAALRAALREGAELHLASPEAAAVAARIAALEWEARARALWAGAAGAAGGPPPLPTLDAVRALLAAITAGPYGSAAHPMAVDAGLLAAVRARAARAAGWADRVRTALGSARRLTAPALEALLREGESGLEAAVPAVHESLRQALAAAAAWEAQARDLLAAPRLDAAAAGRLGAIAASQLLVEVGQTLARLKAAAGGAAAAGDAWRDRCRRAAGRRVPVAGGGVDVQTAFQVLLDSVEGGQIVLDTLWAAATAPPAAPSASGAGPSAPAGDAAAPATDGAAGETAAVKPPPKKAAARKKAAAPAEAEAAAPAERPCGGFCICQAPPPPDGIPVSDTTTGAAKLSAAAIATALIPCARCDDAFHPRCLGLTARAASVRPFVCPFCAAAAGDPGGTHGEAYIKVPISRRPTLEALKALAAAAEALPAPAPEAPLLGRVIAAAGRWAEQAGALLRAFEAAAAAAATAPAAEATVATLPPEAAAPPAQAPSAVASDGAADGAAAGTAMELGAEASHPAPAAAPAPALGGPAATPARRAAAALAAARAAAGGPLLPPSVDAAPAPHAAGSAAAAAAALRPALLAVLKTGLALEVDAAPDILAAVRRALFAGAWRSRAGPVLNGTRSAADAATLAAAAAVAAGHAVPPAAAPEAGALAAAAARPALPFPALLDLRRGAEAAGLCLPEDATPAGPVGDPFEFAAPVAPAPPASVTDPAAREVVARETAATRWAAAADVALTDICQPVERVQALLAQGPLLAAAMEGQTLADLLERGTLYCSCRLPYDRSRPMLACEGGCEGWFHFSCCGLRLPGPKEDASKAAPPQWSCPDCCAKAGTVYPYAEAVAAAEAAARAKAEAAAARASAKPQPRRARAVRSATPSSGGEDDEGGEDGENVAEEGNLEGAAAPADLEGGVGTKRKAGPQQPDPAEADGPRGSRRKRAPGRFGQE